MAGMCTAIIPGRPGECLAPVPDGAPIRLCYLHALLAHQFIEQLGPKTVVAIVRAQGIPGGGS